MSVPCDDIREFKQALKELRLVDDRVANKCDRERDRERNFFVISSLEPIFAD